MDSFKNPFILVCLKYVLVIEMWQLITGKVLYWQSSYDGESLYKCDIPKTGEKPKVVRIEELYQVSFS